MTNRLHPEDIELIAAKITAGGASITVQDPRVNSITRGVAVIMGSIALAVMAWVATSINRLNETMSRIVAQNEAVMAIQGDHSDRIKELERRYVIR